MYLITISQSSNLAAKIQQKGCRGLIHVDAPNVHDRLIWGCTDTLEDIPLLLEQLREEFPGHDLTSVWVEHVRVEIGDLTVDCFLDRHDRPRGVLHGWSTWDMERVYPDGARADALYDALGVDPPMARMGELPDGRLALVSPTRYAVEVVSVLQRLPNRSVNAAVSGA
ncbi:MAG: hypothetical protein K6T83_01050 [Alicyclobacillus sp.]|nr:hypothetical protein [Alicyclobacillus sp.]